MPCLYRSAASTHKNKNKTLYQVPRSVYQFAAWVLCCSQGFRAFPFFPSSRLLDSHPVALKKAHFSSLTALPEPTAAFRLADVYVGRGRLCLGGVHDALLDIGGQAVEGLVDVDVALGRDLEEGDAQLAGELLALLRGNDTLLLPVALVADQDLVDTLGRVLLHVGEPCSDVVKRPLIRNVVNKKNAHRATVIGCRDGAESLLAGRIPDLQLDALAIELDSTDLKIDADGRDEGRRERVLAEP